ncbi:Protein BRICK1 [Rhynchospora pubera]|uniref:Protein BRICK1 n=1 Tax=Rhynchospora pubera TaxID=906938 RepID=A0AAV8E8S8_9POAL|nr:Protein BRICK1 [Rhynchospora pubera]
MKETSLASELLRRESRSERKKRKKGKGKGDRSDQEEMARAGGISNPVNVGIAVQADWENREFISNISLNVRRLFEFLLQFEATTKSKLASLNEKLDVLERKLEVLEVQVSSATTNPSVFN